VLRAVLLGPALLCLLQQAPPPSPPPAARVVAAVAKAARENAALPAGERLDGDALGDLYARKAAAAADGDGKSFLIGLAHGLDPGKLRFRGLESEEEGKARRRDLGKPSLRGRADLLLHFAVSAAAASMSGAAPVEAAGILKERSDMKPGGTGFSFGDLMADLAGIRFAAWVLKEPATRLPRLAKEFRGADFCPDPKGEPEGLTAEAFAKEYGSVEDDRFRAKVTALRQAVAAQAVYAEPAPK
jgi:hypothetical protein